MNTCVPVVSELEELMGNFGFVEKFVLCAHRQPHIENSFNSLTAKTMPKKGHKLENLKNSNLTLLRIRNFSFTIHQAHHLLEHLASP